MTKVYVLQDESSHWYLIPNEEVEMFYKLLEESYNDYEAQDEFEIRFSKYRTGGDLNNKQLYIKDGRD